MPLTPDEKNALVASQKAFLRARLHSERAKEEWIANVRAVSEALLSERVDRLIDLPSVSRLIEESFSEKTLNGIVAPLATAFRADALAWAKSERLPLGHFIPHAGRTEIDKLLEGKNLVPERFLRAVIEHQALENVMREVLHDTIREFNEKMNPFSSEFGIISMLKKMMPLGFGAVSKSIELVRAEFEKRLEPELVKFLNSVSKRALGKMCTMTLEKWQDEEFITLRKSVAAFLYEQPLADFLANVEDPTLETGQRATRATLVHLSTLQRMRDVQSEVMKALVLRFGSGTVGEALTELGVAKEIPFDAFAEASWPIVSAALSTLPAEAFMDALMEEFWSTVPTS